MAPSDRIAAAPDPREYAVWLFLSRRIRMWLLLAIGLPLVRWVLRKVAARASAHNSSSRTASTLHRADSALGSVGRRRGR